MNRGGSGPVSENGGVCAGGVSARQNKDVPVCGKKLQAKELEKP